jgi:hypothetical protein
MARRKIHPHVHGSRHHREKRRSHLEFAAGGEEGIGEVIGLSQ